MIAQFNVHECNCQDCKGEFTYRTMAADMSHLHDLMEADKRANNFICAACQATRRNTDLNKGSNI